MAKRKLKKKTVSDIHGKAFIRATFNNVQVTITDMYGNTLCWSSAGKNGFRGSKKNTPYASQVSAEKAATEAFEMGLRKVEVFVKGPGSGREAAVRALSKLLAKNPDAILSGSFWKTAGRGIASLAMHGKFLGSTEH